MATYIPICKKTKILSKVSRETREGCSGGVILAGGFLRCWEFLRQLFPTHERVSVVYQPCCKSSETSSVKHSGGVFVSTWNSVEIEQRGVKMFHANCFTEGRKVAKPN